MNTLLIRADATTEIGTGHVMRCLALAQGWREQGGRAVFLSHCDSDSLRLRIAREGIDCIPLENRYSNGGDLEEFEQNERHTLRSRQWVAIDGYHFNAGYQERIKEAGYKLLCIDDYGHADKYYADIILNQNISADAQWYRKRESYTRILLGPRYALLRREFRSQRPQGREFPEMARKVLVTMGGSDPDNVTLKVVQALQQIDIPGLEIRIIAGSSNRHIEALNEALQSSAGNFHLLTDVSDMPQQMTWADLAISAGGSTCWELAYMGVPFCCVVLADNQLQLAKTLHERGIAINLGWYHEMDEPTFVEPILHLSANRRQRRAMSRQGKQLIDGNGVQAVVAALHAYGRRR